MTPITLCTDGGSRGNPGPAAIGGVIADEGQTLEEFSTFIGRATNNQAEYQALLAGMERAAKYTDTELTCVLDSELVVKQLNGEYKIKSRELQRLVHQVKALEERFKHVRYEHTLREGNQQADELVNQALDAQEDKERPR